MWLENWDKDEAYRAFPKINFIFANQDRDIRPYSLGKDGNIEEFQNGVYLSLHIFVLA
jgi:hypothetical protein